MGAHAAGTGETWQEANPDVDQPHGLDYRELQDIRIGVRKRIAKEHVTFGDTTAGGEHAPGKCGVLLVCDDTEDFTVFVDATTAPLGSIAYCITHANLWCMTAAASGGAPDFTIIKLGPLSFCLGADYTWSGGIEFDGSVDFTDTVVFDCSVDIYGMLHCWSTAEITGALKCDDSVDVLGEFNCLSDAEITGALAVDGTMTVLGAAEFSSGDFSGVWGIFGTDTTQDTVPSDMTANKVYKTSSDGFIACQADNAAVNNHLKGLVCDSSDGVFRIAAYAECYGAGTMNFISFPVYKDKFFSICETNTKVEFIRYSPIGDGSCFCEDEF